MCLVSFVWHRAHTKQARLKIAIDHVHEAVAVVAAREAHYRTPITRVAGWRSGPTSYVYGYLWTVHSLFYFFRDLASATLTPLESLSPCFRNLQNPIDVAIGEGSLQNATEALWSWIETTHPKWDFVADCMAAPAHEPHYSYP